MQKILIDSALATASHAVRTNISQATGYSPGSVAFHRDMLLDVPLVINLLHIRDKRQIMVDENLRRINAKRSSYDYQLGQKILKRNMNGPNLVKDGMDLLKSKKYM